MLLKDQDKKRDLRMKLRLWLYSRTAMARGVSFQNNNIVNFQVIAHTCIFSPGATDKMWSTRSS